MMHPTHWSLREHTHELENFFECDIQYEGHLYKSAEHLYQALKNEDPEYRKAIRSVDVKTAYKLGREVKLRSDWETVKVDCMMLANWLKFKQNVKLRTELFKTQDRKLYFQGLGPFWNIKNAEILTVIRQHYYDKIGFHDEQCYPKWLNSPEPKARSFSGSPAGCDNCGGYFGKIISSNINVG